MMQRMSHQPLLDATRTLIDDLEGLAFKPPVTHVYNPLIYAGPMFDEYVRRYGQGKKRVLYLGMNPGPWGMAQTGIPFGEVAAVRDFLKLAAPIGKPPHEHPKRPVDGLACQRSEVSGRRLWGAIANHYGTAERFFEHGFVFNYCPLLFLEESAKNRTPEQLPAAERNAIAVACNRYLQAAVDVLQPDWVVGVGNFAEARAREALAGRDVKFGRIPHPSPANPSANRNWEEAARAALRDQGICED